MSAIDRYLEGKEYAAKIRGFANQLNQSGGRDHRWNCDKLRATVAITNTAMGYYGNSSVHPWPEAAIKEIEIEIESRLRELALRAAERVERIAEERRREARREAQEVLEETDQPSVIGVNGK